MLGSVIQCNREKKKTDRLFNSDLNFSENCLCLATSGVLGAQEVCGNRFPGRTDKCSCSGNEFGLLNFSAAVKT